MINPRRQGLNRRQVGLKLKLEQKMVTDTRNMTRGDVAFSNLYGLLTGSVTTRTQANLPASSELTLGQEALGKTGDGPEWALYRFPEHNTRHETLENGTGCTKSFGLQPHTSYWELYLPKVSDLKIIS